MCELLLLSQSEIDVSYSLNVIFGNIHKRQEVITPPNWGASSFNIWVLILNCNIEGMSI